MANVGKELGIFTAGTPEHFNGCTVMYGAEGMIWSKPAYFAFIKPERYTWEFVKGSGYFTVSYFPKHFADIHKVYGYKSGRDINKPKEAGITPEALEHGIGYKEASEIYVCKIIYIDQMKRELEPADVVAKYNDPNDMIYGESHYMIIGEIVDHIVR
ncbi:MAG: flavin reductase [Coriobacteriales bacterium]